MNCILIKKYFYGDIMAKVLLMTIFREPGSLIKQIDNTARLLVKSIKESNPDFVYLFGPKESLPILVSIKRQYPSDSRFWFDSYRFIQVDEIDDVYKYFNAFKLEIKELEEDCDILLDCTSGTTSMKNAATFAAMFFNKNLSVISEETEIIEYQNFFKIYEDIFL